MAKKIACYRVAAVADGWAVVDSEGTALLHFKTVEKANDFCAKMNRGEQFKWPVMDGEDAHTVALYFEMEGNKPLAELRRLGMI